MPFSCERCSAVDIDASWRWCPECGAIPGDHDLAGLSVDGEQYDWCVGVSNLLAPVLLVPN